jgi:carbamoyl-phosphate synthase large subunit
MNILFSSCGRRVELIRFFKNALKDHGTGKTVGVDTNPLASALFEVDTKYIVNKCDHPSFVYEIKIICEKENVNIIIPLIDPELRVYSKNKNEFQKEGVIVIVSDYEVIEICFDKMKTYNFFKETGIPCIRTVDIHEEDIEFPAIIKPRRGSGGINVFEVYSRQEIAVFSRRIEDPIIQEKVVGQEITIDSLVDMEGRPVKIVPRERLEIIAGESSKGRTIRDKELMELTIKLLLKLKAVGPVTIQCFKTEKGYVFSEINPRFGGGYPLSHAAGADFPRLILMMCKGEDITCGIDDYEDNTYFTRYDEAFYLKVSQAENMFYKIYKTL